MIQSYSAKAINELVTLQQVNQVITQVVAWVGGAIVQIFWVMLIFVFMLAAAITLPSATRMGFDADSPMIQRVTTLTNEVCRYVTLMTIVNLLVGLGDTIFLYFMGVPYGVLWGLFPGCWDTYPRSAFGWR